MGIVSGCGIFVYPESEKSYMGLWTQSKTKMEYGAYAARFFTILLYRWSINSETEQEFSMFNAGT